MNAIHMGGIFKLTYLEIIMKQGDLEQQVKHLHKRIEQMKAQRTEAWSKWQELQNVQATREIQKEISSLSGLICSLNYSIMGTQKTYKEACSELISFITKG